MPTDMKKTCDDYSKIVLFCVGMGTETRYLIGLGAKI